jgi:hypothetical protein
MGRKVLALPRGAGFPAVMGARRGRGSLERACKEVERADPRWFLWPAPQGTESEPDRSFRADFVAVRPPARPWVPPIARLGRPGQALPNGVEHPKLLTVAGYGCEDA